MLPLSVQMVRGLGLVVYKMLDFGIDVEEERVLSPELERLIVNMTGLGGKYSLNSFLIFCKDFLIVNNNLVISLKC